MPVESEEAVVVRSDDGRRGRGAADLKFLTGVHRSGPSISLIFRVMFGLNAGVFGKAIVASKKWTSQRSRKRADTGIARENG